MGVCLGREQHVRISLRACRWWLWKCFKVTPLRGVKRYFCSAIHFSITYSIIRCFSCTQRVSRCRGTPVCSVLEKNRTLCVSKSFVLAARLFLRWPISAVVVALFWPYAEHLLPSQISFRHSEKQSNVMAWRDFFFLSAPGTWRNGRHVPLGLIIFLLFNKYRGTRGVLENDGTSLSPRTAFRCPSFHTLQRDPKHICQWIDGIWEAFKVLHVTNSCSSCNYIILTGSAKLRNVTSWGSVNPHQVSFSVSTECGQNAENLTHASQWTPGAELPEVAEHDERVKGRCRVKEGAGASVLLFDRMRVTASGAQPEARWGLRHLFVFLLIRAYSF